jgi:hypothetical protein
MQLPTTTDRAKQIAEEWFPHHAARHITRHRHPDIGGGQSEDLLWARPETFVYSTHYIREGSTLFVTGDIGSAVYQWNNDVSWLNWIASCDYHYFAEKCIASEVGVPFVEWDERQAIAQVEEFLAEVRAGDRDGSPVHIEETGWRQAVSNKDEWHQFLVVNGHEFGDAWYEWLPGCGNRIHTRCIGHLVGLKIVFDHMDWTK